MERAPIGSDAEQTQYLYDGSNVIEGRIGGSVATQYVWSAAGGDNLILRDSDSDNNPATSDSRIPAISGVGLDQRIYAQQDGAGSTTSITDVDGNVLERYVYDQDGQPTALQADYAPYVVTAAQYSSSPNGLQPGQSRWGWVYLFHGGRYVPLLNSALTTVSGGVMAVQAFGGGLYNFGGGSNWFDPYHGVSMTPNYSSYMPGFSPPNSSGDDNDPYNPQEFGNADYYAQNAPGAIGNAFKSAGQQIGYTFTDAYIYSQQISALAQDRVFGTNSYAALPFAHNSSYSAVGQMLDSGQTSVLAATGAATPIFGAGYNVVTGTDLLTGEKLSGADYAAAWFKLAADISLTAAGTTGYVRPAIAMIGRAADSVLTALEKLEFVLDGLDPASAIMPGVVRSAGRGATAASPGYSFKLAVRLDQIDFGLSDEEHFDIANQVYGDYFAESPAIEAAARAKFGDAFVDSLMDGETPIGYTWHHALTSQANGQAGWLQLVDRQFHAANFGLFHPNGIGGYRQWAVPAGAPYPR